MKKLIEELEALKPNTDKLFGFDYGYALGESEGIDRAIEIVHAHNPWYEVGELPPVEELEPDFSIDVMLSDGRQYALGYYIYETRYWNTTIRRGQFKPTHWAYLPERVK